MYSLIFNGEFQLEYPNEFLADLEELKKKHDWDFFGKPVLRDLGHYVDFQKIEDNPEVVENNSEEKSDEEI